jgi:cytochrome b
MKRRLAGLGVLTLMFLSTGWGLLGSSAARAQSSAAATAEASAWRQNLIAWRAQR